MSSGLAAVLLIALAVLTIVVMLQRRPPVEGDPREHEDEPRRLSPGERELHRQALRVPLVCQVVINNEISAMSRELGTGGMSVHTDARLSVSQPAHVAFVLPSGQNISIPAVVWWRRRNVAGFRFDVYDKQLPSIRRWVEDHAERSTARVAEPAESS